MTQGFGNHEPTPKQLEYAYSEALTQPKVGRSRVRFFTGIWRKSHLVAWGQASLKTSPLQKLWGTSEDRIFLHSEIDALARYQRLLRQDSTLPRLEKCLVLVTRLGCDDQPALAKPCPGCMSALLEFGCRSIWWSINGASH